MLTKDFHPSQLLYVVESKRTAKYGNIAALSFGISLCVVCVLPSHWSAKLSNIGIASGLFYLSHKLEKLQKWSDDYSQSTAQQSAIGYRDHLHSSFAPPKREIALAEVTAPIQFADIKQALSKPHIMLLGSTGDGKSTLAKHLAANCSAYTIVIDPHAAPDDWGNLPVYGAGRKYEAIALIMQVTLELLQSRFDERDKGVKTFEPIVIICDEYPAIVASVQAGKIAASWMKLISREARKVSIRLVVLTQSPEVKAIGLEGEGSVRDNFCFVRLGEFAVDHAKSLKDASVKEAIATVNRPAMLGNLPCVIPNLGDRVAMPVVSIPADFARLTSVDKLTEIDELTTIDSPIDTQKPLKAAVNPSIVNLSMPLESILGYAKKQNGFVTASQVKAGIRLFRDTPTAEIRGYFQWLADGNYGSVRGDADTLEFSVS